MSSRILASVFMSSAVALGAGDRVAITGLPDPLVDNGGRRMTSVEAWESQRRPELLELFREHVYGRNAVERPGDLRFEQVGEETVAFDGNARRRRLRVVYSSATGEGAIDVTLYWPAKAKPKGCFVLIVNRGRRIIDEAETRPSEFWPVADIVAQGYATAAFHNQDVAPDRAQDGFKSGVFGLFDPVGRPRAGDAWGAIAAWSWGASRVIDCLQTIPSLQGTPVAVIGHSRGGKAALWCGAQDQRVVLTISNDSGCTGAALARTTRGETVEVINTKFPHWFALNYRRYNGRADALPVDQHALLALMAPRLVYVASASEDDNADPAAEFQACVEAAPVYALYGKSGVGAKALPAAGVALHEGAIGYHLRPGTHDLKREDWLHYLDYADKHLTVRDVRKAGRH